MPYIQHALRMCSCSDFSKSCPAESCNRAGSQRSACRSRRRKKTWPGASPVLGVSKWLVGWLVGMLSINVQLLGG